MMLEPAGAASSTEDKTLDATERVEVTSVIRKYWWIVPLLGTVVGGVVASMQWANEAFEVIHLELQVSRESFLNRLDDHSVIVRAELAGQTRQLEGIADKQREDIGLINGRFEELELQHGLRSVEHTGVTRDVGRVLGDVHFELGQHIGRHHTP